MALVDMTTTAETWRDLVALAAELRGSAPPGGSLHRHRMRGAPFLEGSAHKAHCDVKFANSACC